MPSVSASFFDCSRGTTAHGAESHQQRFADPSTSQTQQPENPQQNQVRLAQEAQARIQARRAARKQRVVQDTYSHKFEVYGGGGYTRFRPGESLQHINESPGMAASPIIYGGAWG